MGKFEASRQDWSEQSLLTVVDALAFLAATRK